LRYLSHEQQLEVYVRINLKQKASPPQDFKRLPPELRAMVFERSICDYLSNGARPISDPGVIRTFPLPVRSPPPPIVSVEVAMIMLQEEIIFIIPLLLFLSLVWWIIHPGRSDFFVQLYFGISLSVSLSMILLNTPVVRWFWTVFQRCIRPPEIPMFTIWHEFCAMKVLIRDIVITLPLALCETAQGLEETEQAPPVVFHQLPIFNLNDQLTEEAVKVGQCLRTRVMKRSHEHLSLCDPLWVNRLLWDLRMVEIAQFRKRMRRRGLILNFEGETDFGNDGFPFQ
jgi:hypothetical protein